jgi:hypothetical protein
MRCLAARQRIRNVVGKEHIELDSEFPMWWVKKTLSLFSVETLLHFSKYSFKNFSTLVACLDFVYQHFGQHYIFYRNIQRTVQPGFPLSLYLSVITYYYSVITV